MCFQHVSSHCQLFFFGPCNREIKHVKDHAMETGHLFRRVLHLQTLLTIETKENCWRVFGSTSLRPRSNNVVNHLIFRNALLSTGKDISKNPKHLHPSIPQNIPWPLLVVMVAAVAPKLQCAGELIDHLLRGHSVVVSSKVVFS